MLRITAWMLSCAAACGATPAEQPPPSVELALAPDDGTPVPGGQQFVVTITGKELGGGTIDGDVVTLSTSVMGIGFVPATVSLDSNGRGTATVIIPYGTSLAATATTGDGGVTTTSLQSPAITIGIETAIATSSVTAAGQVYELTATATVIGTPVEAVPLAFATNAMGATFTPASLVTDAEGRAISHVFVPASALPITGIVSGGGGVQDATIASVVLGPVTVGTGVPTAMGTAVPVTVTVKEARSGIVLPGIAVKFAALAGSTCTPDTVITDDSGKATSEVYETAGTEVVVSAAGVVAPAVRVP